MQFNGFRINNLKSYRKYFSFQELVRAIENGTCRQWMEKQAQDNGTGSHGNIRFRQTVKEIGKLLRGEERDVQLFDSLVSEARYGQAAGEISRLLASGDEKRDSSSKTDRKWYRKQLRILLLCHALADAELESPAAAAEWLRRRAPGTAGRTDSRSERDGRRRTDLNGENCRLPLAKLPEGECALSGTLQWIKIENSGSMPAEIILEGTAKTAARRLAPGGWLWYLDCGGDFVRWGHRVRVQGNSYACTDRQGRLIADGHPMRGGDMADFSFDARTGILGTDADCRLRQYSALEIPGEEGELAAVAVLQGDSWLLAAPDGQVRTNDPGLAFHLAEVPECLDTDRLAQETGMSRELAGQITAVSCSRRLMGFETADSRTGVWDLRMRRLIWMEE